jgi:ribosomal protein S18 acetylase RimI-like enzyme
MTPGSSLAIRPAVIGDAEAIGQMAQEFAAYQQTLGGEAAYCLTPERIRLDGFGPSPAFAGIVAAQEGVLLGYLLHHPGYATDLAERYLVVCDLFVREAGRRRGVGRALMSAARAHCRSVGGSGLFWSVLKTNEAALAFYRRLDAATAETFEYTWWPAP